ncbi:MAG: hypothetical protein MJZ34_02850 [Paludibacteraceae bacterium]|nr:hypothetical protein [Paludibacteraceae bacterium]
MNNAEDIQKWVDQLASFTDVSKNNVIEWAKQAPIISLEQFETIPLYLYGDVTLDKAITNILQNGAVEPEISNIYNILSNSYRAPLIEDKETALVLSDIPAEHNSQPADWNNYIQQSVEKIQPKELNSNTISRDRIGDEITVLKYQQAHQVDARLDSQNAVNFSNGNIQQAFDRHPFFSAHGFITDAYDEKNFILTNGSLTYICNYLPVAGVYECENNDGDGFSSKDPIQDIMNDIQKQPAEKQTYFSVNFDETIQDNDMQEVSTVILENNSMPDVSFSMYQLANIMCLFQNDLLYMHHHAIGDHFDTVHNVTQELYEKAAEQVDTLAEMAIRLGEPINNFNNAQSVISSDIYAPINDGEFDADKMESELNKRGEIVISAMKRCRQYESEIMSKMDELISAWAKEIEYKNVARMKNFSAENKTSAAENDIVQKVAATATAIAEDLSEKYEQLLTKISNKYAMYKELTALQSKLMEYVDETTGTVDDEHKQLLTDTNLKLEAVYADLVELLALEKEYNDVTVSKTRKGFKKELSELTHIIENKNFAKSAKTINQRAQEAARNLGLDPDVYKNLNPRNPDDFNDLIDVIESSEARNARVDTNAALERSFWEAKVRNDELDDNAIDEIIDSKKIEDYIKGKSSRLAEIDLEPELYEVDRQKAQRARDITAKFRDKDLAQRYKDRKAEKRQDLAISNELLEKEADLDAKKAAARAELERNLRKQYLDDDLEYQGIVANAGKDRDLKWRQDHQKDEIALEQAKDKARRAYLLEQMNPNIKDSDINLEIQKRRILQKAQRLDDFKDAVTDGVIDVIFDNIDPAEALSAYDEILGENIIENHPGIDKMLYKSLGTIVKSKEPLRLLTKAAARAIGFSSKVDRNEKRVEDRAVKMGFSREDAKQTIKMLDFPNMPVELLTLDNMTKEVLFSLTAMKGSEKQKRQFEKVRHNFSNETYEEISFSSMPARLKYSIQNPRYNYSEDSWAIGDKSDV